MPYYNNAIMAKVRALYGKRLTVSDYDQLLSKKNVGEIAGYLKNETYYSENLQEVKEELIHRRQLENLVRRRILNTYMSIMKYTNKNNLSLSMFVMKNEIDQILMAIRLLNSDSMDRYIVSLPVQMNRLLSFDLFAVAKVTSFDGLLTILEHSDYYRILGKFRPSTADKIIDITGCEAALLTYYYKRAFETVDEYYKGKSQGDLIQLLQYQISVHNITVIYRMRRYLSASKEMIVPRLLPLEGSLRAKFFDRLLDAPNLPAFYEELRSLKTVRRFDFDWNQSSQKIVSTMDRVHKRQSQKLFRFSMRPTVTVITYMTLLEIEVRNIVNIIEGIRYGVPPAEIRLLLTL